jgi:hypothetical protein
MLIVQSTAPIYHMEVPDSPNLAGPVDPMEGAARCKERAIHVGCPHMAVQVDRAVGPLLFSPALNLHLAPVSRPRILQENSGWSQPPNT